MGLDMYLIKKKYIGKAKIKILDNEYSWHKKENDTEYSGVSAIEMEAGYWRKANQIHRWFVENCQDGIDNCEEYYVSEEKLEELLEICKRIKEECPLEDGKVKVGETLKDGEWITEYKDGKIMKNAELAEELLPSQSGFFFGSTDYDEYYMQDIEDTIKIIEDVLKDKTCDTYYHSSW